jgi:thiamine-monophosphate kinase
MLPRVARRGEFDLIASFFAPLARGDERGLNLLDDGAVLPQRDGRDTIVSTDTFVSGVHFFVNESPAIIARRLLRVNLSDIAAMAAEPVGYFLNLSLSAEIDDSWIKEFAAGLSAEQEEFGISLWGGDTTRTPGNLTLSVTLLGELPSGAAVRRSTARDGDRVFVSGTIGDAGLGLSRLADGVDQDDKLVRRYQLPDPRVDLGIALRDIVSAMADVSDGLISDLGHICNSSEKSATITAEDIPLSAGARSELEAGNIDLGGLLTSGDDYELVFTVPPSRLDQVLESAACSGTTITKIGVMGNDTSGVRLLAKDGTEVSLQGSGYRHF